MGYPITKHQHEVILVVVDNFSKMASLIPCEKLRQHNRCLALLRMYLETYVLPMIIISDRDLIFISIFYNTLQKHLNMRLSLSTTFDPETDRQKEVVNRLVVQLLCMYNHKHHRTWDASIPYIQHSYNHAQHSSRGKSPFHIYYGFQPSAPIELINSLTQSNDTDFDRREVEKVLKFRDKIYNIQKKSQEMLQ